MAPSGPSLVRRSSRRIFFGAAGVVVAAVLVIGALWLLQRSLIYFPDTSEVPSAAAMLTEGEDLTLETSDGLSLGAWFAPADPSAEDRDFAVLMAPGNGGNRESRAGLADALQEEGFAVLVLDYRGYSTNPGTPSEEGLLRDGAAAVEALRDQGYPPERTIYFGESIGGGVIAGLLSKHPPAAAVFRSPFTDLADVGRTHYPWLPVRTILRDDFPVIHHVSQTQVPISVIRAERDSVVPSHLSADVAEAAPNLVEHEVIPAADHNDTRMFGPEIAAVVGRLADTLEE
ncbi:alpha/beta hydrolase [Nesterenkonia sphaerica]|uniref:Alpha/beta fold hydrolase n=1 Tax=Nesterenkonia sphaerica TaxID=1804988 RepID=A0A5R9A5U6_9MICC|nr:alpha/beta fold hydrolase [Nesterenkonia sphaerica]TLP74051.1 alpha/beta fold hydrolase [Nesterenkonia sphaerica]